MRIRDGVFTALLTDPVTDPRSTNPLASVITIVLNIMYMIAVSVLGISRATVALEVVIDVKVAR